jgi:hypothetical protein
MSSNAVAAMAVILVSGFAGCAATGRAAELSPAAVAPALAPAPSLRPAAEAAPRASVRAASARHVRTLVARKA